MGLAGAILNLINLDSWSLLNIDTGESLEGQFHAEELTENISARYETHTTFSRQKPNVQFINGDADTISFNARFFETSILSAIQLTPRALDTNDAKVATLKEKIALLKSWAKVDPDERRPPLLRFVIGDGSEVSMEQCVITSLGGIKYARPRSTGGMRDVMFSISLLEYNKFSLEDYSKNETRYHNVTEGEYYEMLTLREYGDPKIGDVIRKRHPTQPVVEAGDTVKLPSYSAIETEVVTQTSVALKTGWGKKDTPQKRLRQSVLESRNRTYISHIVLED